MTKIRQGATVASVDKYCISPGVCLGDNDASAHIKCSKSPCPQPSPLELDFSIPFLFDEKEDVWWKRNKLTSRNCRVPAPQHKHRLRRQLTLPLGSLSENQIKLSVSKAQLCSVYLLFPSALPKPSFTQNTLTSAPTLYLSLTYALSLSTCPSGETLSRCDQGQCHLEEHLENAEMGRPDLQTSGYTPTSTSWGYSEYIDDHAGQGHDLCECRKGKLQCWVRNGVGAVSCCL